MRKVPYLFFLLLLGSCYDQVDGFYPLSETNKRKLPASYTVGDTLVYVYSDSVSMDTLSLVVQPNKDFLVRGEVIPDTYHVDYHQVIEQELKPLNGSESVRIIIGTGYNRVNFDSERFYLLYKGQRLYSTYLSSVKSDPDIHVYELKNTGYSWSSAPDSVFISYSTYTGIQHVENINEGYELKRIQ